MLVTLTLQQGVSLSGYLQIAASPMNYRSDTTFHTVNLALYTY